MVLISPSSFVYWEQHYHSPSDQWFFYLSAPVLCALFFSLVILLSHSVSFFFPSFGISTFEDKQALQGSFGFGYHLYPLKLLWLISGAFISSELEFFNCSWFSYSAFFLFFLLICCLIPSLLPVFSPFIWAGAFIELILPWLSGPLFIPEFSPCLCVI